MFRSFRKYISRLSARFSSGGGFVAAAFLVSAGIHNLKADILDEWNSALLDTIRAEDTAPCLAARNLAIMHGAIYDASVAIHGNTKAFYFQTSKNPAANLEAALNAASLTVANSLHPSRRGKFDHLYKENLSRLGDSESVQEGDRLGKESANAWIGWRASDGHTTSLPYIPKTDPGAWRRTMPFFRPPDLPAWCLVQPFTMVGSAQFRPPGPPSLTSEKWANEFNTLKKFGGANSTSRTAEQGEIAKFWSDFSYTVTPPGHWNQIAQEISDSQKLPLVQKARLFAVLNVALADVGIACWEAKYHYNFWRPVTAIRVAETDGNPATEPEKDWKPLLNTPAFPEYISGHSAFSSAAATVLTEFLGSDNFEFSVPSDSLPGVKRSFHSLSACANEISQSRMYGGIHFPSALNDGMKMGQQIAIHVLGHFFRSEVPEVASIYAAPLELKPGYWVGVTATRGRQVAIEHATTSGEWRLWTNGIAQGPVIRWKVSDFPELASLRISLQ